MALQGIDISSWQSGIDLSAVPCDFVIAKATEGTGYTNPDCARAIEQAISLGKSFGVYHYVAGGNAQGEADYFVDSVSGWLGRGILAIDWEAGGNSAWGDTGYLDAVIKRVIQRTGIKPLVYASQSAFPWSIASQNDCGAWVAQYGGNDATGYQDSPWNEGSYDCAIRQYSSAGSLPGYSGSLDLNKFYGDVSTWAAYAGAEPQQGPHQEPGEPVNDAGLFYRAHVASLGWLDPVRDGQAAGTTGHGLQLEALKIDPPDGLELDAKLHIQDVGWTTFTDVAKNDPVIGTEGRALRAEAMELDVKSNTTGRKLWYQVHLADVGWTGWVEQGYAAGTVGIGKAIEAMRMKLV